MTLTSAGQLALQLATFATRTGGPLPLLDGSSGSLGLTGLAFLAKARQRAPAALWFRQTPTFKVLAAGRQALLDWDAPGEASPADQRDYVLVVQWRRLLSKALLRHESTASVPAELRRLAHQAWWTLMPLIEEYDVVLAQLLTAAIENYRANPVRVNFEPLWVGFDTQDDELRFDAQVATLLASRRTEQRPFDGFCEAAGQWFNKAFVVATNQVAQRTVGLCTVNNHVRGGHCETCPEIAEERRFLLALDVPSLLDPRIRRLITPTTKAKEPQAPSPMRDSIRWIIDSRSRFDGTVRFHHLSGAPARFIDVQRLRERWQELKMPNMFDGLPPPIQIDGSRQARAFLEKALNNATLPETSYSPKDLFTQAGWGTEEDFDTSYSQFIAVFEGSLLRALQILDQRAYALVKARTALPVVPKQTRPSRRVVTRDFTPSNGEPAVPIGVIRTMSTGRVTRNFYTLPYDIDEPTLEASAGRSGKGIKYDGQIYWTWRTVNEIANRFGPDNEPVYSWGREFCEWVGEQEPLLDDPKLFNAAIYSDRLPQRLAAVARGDKAHLGAFSLQEDAAITEFFVTKQAQKRLAPQDWLPLLARLPGRTERGILKRFEELAKKYAFSHGYQGYLRSPWHRKFSAQRRKQWVKEGCPQ